MSTDYTPTTAEDWMPTDMQVEVAFMAAPGHMTGPGDRHRAYRRWLAAHDREVAAKALEDAADQINREFQNLPSWDEAWRNGYRTDEWMSGGVRMVTDAVNRLRARAAALRIEGKEDQ